MKRRYTLKLNGKLLDNRPHHSAVVIPVVKLGASSPDTIRMGDDPSNLHCLHCGAEPDCMVQVLELAQLGFAQSKVVVIAGCALCEKYSGVEFERIELSEVGVPNE